MKRVQILGLSSAKKTDFSLQLVSAMSRSAIIHAVFPDPMLYKALGALEDSILQYEKLTITPDIGRSFEVPDVLVTFESVAQSDVAIVIVEQTHYCLHCLKEQLDQLNTGQIVIVYLEFHDSALSVNYFNRYHIKPILGSLSSSVNAEKPIRDIIIPFDERDCDKWIKRMMDYSLSVNGLSKKRFKAISEIIDLCLSTSEKGAMPMIRTADRRWRTC